MSDPEDLSPPSGPVVPGTEAEPEAGSAAAAERDRLAEMLDQIFVRAPIGLAFFDRELRFVRVNEELAKINGIPVAEHLGRRFDEVIDHPTVARVNRLLERVVREGVEIREVLVGDEDRSFLASYFPVSSGAGAVVVDITAHERQLDEERRQNLRLRHRHALSDALARASTPSDVAEVLASECCGAIGMERGWVSLLSARDRRLGIASELELAASVGYPDSAVDAFRSIPLSAELPGPDSLRDGRDRWYGSLKELHTEYPDLSKAYGEAGNEAGVVVPLFAFGEPLGFVALADPSPRVFSEDEKRIVLEITARASQVLARALLHEREHALAETLQRALMPSAIVSHPRVEIAARYLPAGFHTAVGGDWYDAFAAPCGLFVVVGDVAGHGASAAAQMGELATVVRAHARTGRGPAEVLGELARYMNAEAEAFVGTVACCALDPETRTLRVARAGHPPPLVVGDETARTVDVGLGPAIGISKRVSYSEGEIELAPGDTVLLFTDGLIEERRLPKAVALPELEEAAARIGGPASVLVETLARERFGGRAPRDDVAALAVTLAQD